MPGCQHIMQAAGHGQGRGQAWKQGRRNCHHCHRDSQCTAGAPRGWQSGRGMVMTRTSWTCNLLHNSMGTLTGTV